METRRLVLLMIFSLSLIMLWDNYQASIGKPTLFGLPAAATSEEKAQPAASITSTNDLPAPAANSADLPQAASNGVADVAEAAPVPQAQTITIATDVLELQFSTQGAQLVGSKLLQHPDAINPGLPTQLFEQSSDRTYLGQAGVVGVAQAPNHRTLFEFVSGNTSFAPGSNRLDLVFKASSGGVESTYTYTVYKDRYDIDFQLSTRNVGEAAITPSAYLQITRDGNPLESDSTLYATFTGPAMYSPEKKYQKIKFSDIADRSANYVKSTDSGWLAIIQHYFVSAIIGQQGPRENYTRQVDSNLYSIGLVSNMGTIEPGQVATYNAKWYTGPQDQRVLEELAPGLELVVDYGWLTVVAQPIYWLLEKIHSVVGNWGWAIVVLTILIKLVFFPLSAASYKSMAKMRKVGPRMQKLKEQYGDDKMGFQRAMMELYKREKINPLGGCMPILIQIPVFIALYWVLLASVEMRNAPWLGWVTDLAAPDPFYILPVIMAVTMFIQTKLNPTPPDPVQAKIMMIMPLVFSVMFIFFPAGLVLYWVVNNILSIAQQWVITRQIESAPATAR
ncbi:membrane protein insertase YidC [Limnobacter sp.]|uniref:membrane protein insertase YidC n=1 Tax=Limnobacter sp. TaxID=2003368 RepID=UPI00351238B1